MPEINLYNQDCMEGMKDFPDKYFDLAIIDPPYGIGAGGKRFINGTSKTNKPYYRENDWDVAIPSQEYFTQLFKISKNQIIWGANHFIDNFPFMRNSSCWIVWDKGTGDNGYADGELAWTSFKSVLKIFKKSWVGANAKDGYRRIHPTQKPIALYKWLLKNYAKEGDTILDTHLGSGSIAIACYDMGFDLTGYEIDKDYFEAMTKRFNNHKLQLQIEYA